MFILDMGIAIEESIETTLSICSEKEKLYEMLFPLGRFRWNV
jgi:hypothetical protein